MTPRKIHQPNRRGRITAAGPLQKDTHTEMWRWACLHACVPNQYGQWQGSREDAREEWEVHRTAHFPSGAQLIRAMGGPQPRSRRRRG
jgi:hypothetical protein